MNRIRAQHLSGAITFPKNIEPYINKRFWNKTLSFGSGKRQPAQEDPAGIGVKNPVLPHGVHGVSRVSFS